MTKPVLIREIADKLWMVTNIGESRDLCSLVRSNIKIFPITMVTRNTIETRQDMYLAISLG